MKFENKYLIIIFSLIIWSCNSNEKKNVETVTIEELIGESDSDLMVKDTLETHKDSIIIKETKLLNLVQTLISDYDTTTLNNSHPIDRYGFSLSEKIKFIAKTNVAYGKSSVVTPKAEVYIYNFSDSIKLNNAFYNWLDCFGSDCEEVKLNQDIEYVKTPPSFTLIYDTTLISVKYLCEHQEKNWEPFQKSIITTYGKNYRYRIDVNCGGPLKWK